MKNVIFLFLSFFILVNCNPTKNKANSEIKKDNSVQLAIKSFTKDTSFSFEEYQVDKIPNGWSQSVTGKRKTTNWQVINDSGNKVLAQLSMKNPNSHFNNIVYDGFKVKNMELKVKMKGVKGRKDQGGGFIWRYTDADNYYVVRANPLEDNVVLYKVKNGRRTDLPLIGKGRTYGIDVEPLGNDWNNLKLKVIDDLFTVYLNDEQIFQVKDNTFTKAGKIGLWTKADAVSYFDDFKIKSLD